ncbi:MAG TPA: phosphohistidine phosphatase SixA [Cyanobacteria bacterium UBA11149]|nr:phosphohistidine phosphatase SixA [Cyanobacteria bacterium UBA11367]HBE58944.1 phosphohistidine phosphatase SixA [Cyanobacteria bacterium UBA11366]HBK62514.1 phosphohistidine phosphatase SixA [Cyanobacteria bacterium UBA11166]HBR74739.1 phosphohistidine phosphatase SixA [Cyanobacteria bacterium UBA11159]HBS72609.1 phosphohistidine phosphatase SixA [Cyanobacteria bacterium UBA11153]HBW90071.1 phosphohistidine phosphatase SixA [Cyanobacteria bacterium UBA11149]HCA94307.1 phosphohistidine pho
MQLYLIRHGIATEPQTDTNDTERTLTEKGRQKTRQVAKQLREKEVHFDLILTSPLIRARETAAILKDLGLTSHVEEFTSLSPNGDIHTWINWLEEWRKSTTIKGCLALVGHQPDLSNWAETLIWGEAKGKLVLKKAGIIGLSLPENGNPIGESQLFLLAAPKWLL